MERAHSWLRTIAIANWTGSSILAPHVQGLMELISALKVVLQLVAADSVAAPVVAAGRHDGREGPVLCSLVSLARRTVVESMSVSQGTLHDCDDSCRRMVCREAPRALTGRCVVAVSCLPRMDVVWWPVTPGAVEHNLADVCVRSGKVWCCRAEVAV